MTIDGSIRARWFGGARALDEITAVVFHYTANTGHTATARSNACYFATGARKASAHFVVDEADVAYQCVPLEQIAWAVGDGTGGTMGMLVNNRNSVSIEMVSHTDEAETAYIPLATQKNAAHLYQMLRRELPGIQYAVRHYDVSKKLCPAPLVDEACWAEFQVLLQEELNMTKQELLALAGTGDTPSDWAMEATHWAKEMGVFSGDGAGNYGWQQPITREAVAQVLYNLARKEERKSTGITCAIGI